MCAGGCGGESEMKLRKAETTFKTLIIALLVGGLAMASVGLFLGGFSNNYDAEFTDQETLANLNQYNNISSTVGDIRATLENSDDADQGILDRVVGVIDAVFSNGYQALRLLIGVPGQYLNALSTALSALGIPASIADLVVNVLFTIILAIALLLIVQAVTSIR